MSLGRLPSSYGYTVAVVFQVVLSQVLHCLLLTNGSQGDSGVGIDVTVTVTRLNDGDEFTNPLACGATCPVGSALKGNSKCVCKCCSQFTWRQDLGTCVESSGCDFTVFDGDYVPAMKILDKPDTPLLPDNHALRRKDFVMSRYTSDKYQFQKMNLLGKDPWSKARGKSDFYLGVVMEGQRSVQKVKSKTQPDKIEDYTGTVLNFTVKEGSDKGCLMVKIHGNLTYNAIDFPRPVCPATTANPRTQPASGTSHPSSRSSPTMSTIPQSRLTTSSPPQRFSSTPSVGGSTTTVASRTVTTALPASTDSTDLTTATATDGLDLTVRPSVLTASVYSQLTSTLSDVGSTADLSTTAFSQSVQRTDVFRTHSNNGDGTATTVSKTSPSSVSVIGNDVSASKQQNDDINAAAIAGGIVAGVMVLLLIVLIIVFVYRRNMKSTADHEVGSSLCNPMYSPGEHGHFKAIHVDNPSNRGAETAPAEHDTVNNEAYEEPAGIVPTSVSASQGNDIYEEPLAMTETRDHALTPFNSNGYASMIPQVDQPPSVGQTFDDSLYEEIATTVASSE